MIANHKSSNEVDVSNNGKPYSLQQWETPIPWAARNPPPHFIEKTNDMIYNETIYDKNKY